MAWGGSRSAGGGGGGNSVTITLTAEDNASSVIGKLRSELNKLGDAGQDNTPKVDGLLDAFKKVKGSLKDVNASLKGFGPAFKDLGGSLKGVGGSFRGFDGSLKGLGGSFKGVGTSLKGFKAPLKGLGGSLKGLGGAVGGVSKAFGPWGMAIAEVISKLGLLAAPLFKAAVEMENLKSQLKAVQGSSEAAEKRFGELAKVSKEITGLDLGSLIKYDNVLQTVGVSARDSATVMRGVAQAASEAGKSAAQTQSIMEQLSQAFASNKVASEDLKTVWRELPKVQTVAKDLFGETAGTIEGLRETFKLLGIDARTGLTELFDGVSKVTEIDTNKFSTQWEMFTETMSQWAATLGGPLRDAARELLKGLNALAEGVEWIGTAIGDLFKDEETKRAEKRAQELAALAAEVQREAYDKMKTARDAYLESTRNAEEGNFKVRREIANNYFDSQIEYINSLPIKDEEKNKKLEANAQAKKKRMDQLNEEEHEYKVNLLKNEVLEEQKKYDELEAAGTASATELKEIRQSIADKNAELISLEVEDDTQKYNQLKSNAETAASDIKGIDEKAREDKAKQYKDQLVDAENYYEDLKRDENASVEDLKAARLAVYHYNKEIINTTVTDETEKRDQLADLARETKDDINKIQDDRTKYNKQKRDEEVAQEEEARKASEAEAEKLRATTANKNKLRAEETKTELQNILNDETSSVQERINKNNQYYGFLMAEAANRETDATKRAAALEKIERDRVTANTKIETDFAKEQDTRRKNEEKAQKDAAKDAEERAKDLSDKKIGELNRLEQEQLGVIAELDRADDTSVEDRIEATKRLYGIRLAKLNENKEDNKNWAADKQKLENDLLEEISDIIDEDEKRRIAAAEKELTEKKRIAKERLDVEQDSYDRITDSAESSADEINEAAEELYQAKLDWITLNVEDEEQAAKQILQAQKELDQQRTTSIELFYKRNEELLNAGKELAIDVAKTQINISRETAIARRDIEQDYQKSKIDFEAEHAAIVAHYARLETEARAEHAPQIQAARDRGDETEANRLQTLLDNILGVNETGQTITDDQGNLIGLVKKRSDALQEVTDVLNGASRDYFGALRDIEDEAKKQRARGWWDTIGNVLDFGLEKAGEGVGALFGSPEIGKFVGDIAGDLAQIGTTHLGDVAVDKITDQQLKRQLREYQTNAARRAENEARGIGSSELQELFEGTDFDPAVIEQKMLDAEAAIAARAQEIYEDEVRKLKRSTDAKKRILDKAKDDESRNIEDVLNLHTQFYERRKALLQLTVKDEKDLNDQLIRLNWEQSDAREDIVDLFERREEERNAKREKNERDSSNKTIETKKETDEIITGSDESKSQKLIDNSDKVTKKVKDNASEEVDAMKASYEAQVQINTDLKEQIETLQKDLADIKSSLLIEDTDNVEAALSTQVTATATAGFNILDIVRAINAGKASAHKEDVEDNKESLEEQEEDTKKSGINILDIVAALNAQKEALNLTSLTTQTEQFKTHYEELKQLDLDWNLYRNRNEGFHGLIIQTRLDNSKEDYREFFTDIKAQADEAYSYINSRVLASSPSRARRRSRSRRSGELFHDPINDAMAYIGGARAAGTSSGTPTQRKNAQDFTDFFSQGMLDRISRPGGGSSTSNQPVILKFAFETGVTKEIAGEIQQLENDKRIFQN